MSDGAYLCRFSSLDDLTQKRRGQVDWVLQTLKAAGRFSIFEVDDKLGKTLTALFAQKLIEADEAKGAYPWTYVRVTEKGEALLGLGAIARSYAALAKGQLDTEEGSK